MIVGFACPLSGQVAAIFVSLVGARRRGGWPVVAFLYGLAGLVGVGAWAYDAYEARQWYRDNPEAFSIEWNEEGTEVGVRTGEGVWWVPVDQCPNVETETASEMGTQSLDGYIEVSVGSDVPHMRLYPSERRVECLLADLPLSDATLAEALGVALDAEPLRPYLPEGPTLLLRGSRLPPMDSIRVDARPVHIADGSAADVIEIRLLDPQPDRVVAALEMYQEGVSARIESTRAGDGPWVATVQSLTER